MRALITQILVMALVVRGDIQKRSPLQTGLVTFPGSPHSGANVTIPTIIKSAHTHKWIPGHVQQNAFIPAHLHHIYIPTHAVLLDKTVATVLVTPAEVYNPYRRHFGGFGIGVDRGGPGGGHGFHVIIHYQK